MRLGLVTGLAREATRLRHLDLGPGHELLMRTAFGAAASVAAESLVAAGAEVLVSAGYAGALAPEARSGDLIVAEAVATADGRRFQTDPDWQVLLLRRTRSCGIPAHGGGIAESGQIVATPEDKRALFARTGAWTVDQESGRVARVAAARGLRFAVLRVVLDPSGRALPRAATAGATATGATSAGPMLAALARRPWEIVDLLHLVGDTRRADATLGRVGRIGPGLLPLD